MSIFNLTKHSDNYVEILGGLRKYHKDIPNDNIADSESFKLKVRMIGRSHMLIQRMLK